MTTQEEPSIFAPDSLRTIGLTQRETEVLAWVAEGKSNKEVGLVLGIRPVTVKKHLEHIFQKMDVRTRTAAVVVALRLNRQITKPTAFWPFLYGFSDLAGELTASLAPLL